MPVHEITAIDDPRLDPYRNLRRTNRTRWSGQFVVESHRAVRRLLESGLRIESILVIDRRRGILDDVVPADVQVLVVPKDLASELAGFHFHQGVMACGYRPTPPSLDELVGGTSGPLLLVACPRMTDPDNLGGLIRLCVGFGVRGLLLGPDCADPFSRRVLRVSMGTAFQLPLIEQCDLPGTLGRLRSAHRFRILATVLDRGATPLMQLGAIDRAVLVLGNEADGLDPASIALSDERVTIPMADGADSLNVTVATGIFLHSLAAKGGHELRS